MNINKSKILASALVALILPGLATGQTAPDKPTVSTVPGVPMPKGDRVPMADFKKLLADRAVVTIDVRSNRSYQEGHIPGALSMPGSTIDATAAQKLARMGKLVATYCSCPAEHTAAIIAQNLQRMGIPAQAIVGGYNLWVQEKNPVKTGPDVK